MKIMVLCKDAPAEIGSAGSIRLYRIIKALRALHEVYVVCSSADYGTNPLQKIGAEALVRQSCYENIEKLSQEQDIDLVLISWWYIAKNYYGAIKRWMPNAKIIIDSVDLEYKRNEMLMKVESEYVDGMGIGEYEKKKLDELEMYKLADYCWVASDKDKEELQNELSDTNIDVVPIIYDFNYPKRDPGIIRKNSMIFVGNFLHNPNVDAVMWFGKEIFPKIKEKIEDVEFIIVGKWAPKEVQELVDIEGIEFRGIEYNLEKLLREMDISIAPIRFLSGMNGKIVEAIVHEIPVVTTPEAAKVLNLEHKKDVMLASSEEEFSKVIIELLKDEELKNSIIKNAKEKIQPIVDYEIVKDRILKII